MTNETRGDFPNITLDKDDLDSFHRTRSQANNKNKKSPTPDKTPNAQTNSPSWLSFLFLILLLGAGFGYWSFLQYEVLQQAQTRITELENRLSATGEDMDQSAAALQVKVVELTAKTNELWEQMDKLWASAWRKNQAEIGTLNKSVASLQASSQKLDKQLKSDAADNQTTLGLLQEQLENQASLVKQLNIELDDVNLSAVSTEQEFASLKEKMISTALANNNLTNRINDLSNEIDILNTRVLAAEKANPNIGNIGTPKS
ncbi:hypothetical protein [Paraglaciecola marina]|uniref:hypothetical protein n=1 Tax=Paraglaciecola marina TaxID=2500157 RepID=UPI0010615FA9|nr:hypothetical protein [Paraglaciecola marina]